MTVTGTVSRTTSRLTPGRALALGLAALLCGCMSLAAPPTDVHALDDRDGAGTATVQTPHVSDDPLTRRTLYELNTFTSWLDEFDQKGVIGVGWPAGPRWNALARRWYEMADQESLWITAPGADADGRGRLAVYRPGPGVLDRDGSLMAMAVGDAPASRRTRGVDLDAGASTGQERPFSNEAPGRYVRDYRYPRPATLAHLADRGVGFVRIGVRWERIQPAPFDPLNRNELRRLRRTIAAAGDAGLRVVIDLHNFGGYRFADDNGPRRAAIGSDGLPGTALVDMWRRISAEFSGNRNVVAYGLMHGPDDLSPTDALPRPRYTWDADVQGWEGPVAFDTRIARSGAGSLRLRWPRGATSMFVSDGRGVRRDCSRYGALLSVWVRLPPAAPVRSYTASLQVQDAAYEYNGGDHVQLRPGHWTQVRYSAPAGVLGGCRAVALHLTGPRDRSSAGVSVNVDDLTQRGRLLPAQVWEATSQAVVSTLRDRGDDTIILVGGHGRSMLQTWPLQHPRPWIIDPSRRFRYEAYHFWNERQRGVYGSYDDEVAAAAVDLSAPTSVDRGR
ncbi:hypothetical protein BH23ACT10_BH23ACT10_32390 [soil metagenome]